MVRRIRINRLGYATMDSEIGLFITIEILRSVALLGGSGSPLLDVKHVGNAESNLTSSDGAADPPSELSIGRWTLSVGRLLCKYAVHNETNVCPRRSSY